MRLGLNNENKDIREEGERALARFKKLEERFERTREKVVERTGFGTRVRYVKRDKNKRDDERPSGSGTGDTGGANDLPPVKRVKELPGMAKRDAMKEPGTCFANDEKPRLF